MADIEPIKVLLIEDNPGDARLAEVLLEDIAPGAFRITHVERIAAALERLDEASYDVALLDLSLPDTKGLAGVECLQQRSKRLPIVVLSGLDDAAVSLEAVQKGAQDYLVKGQDSGEVVARSIRYAIERKREQKLLMEAKERAEYANRTKSEFLAAVSHELRTPLNAIIGFSEMMRDEVLGPVGNDAYCEYADHIYNSGSHLLGIINDILDLAKVEAGTAELNEEEVDVSEVFETSRRMFEARCQQAGNTLTCEIADGLPPLRADRLKLQQVLVNLLSNAVKFTPAGGNIVCSAYLEPNGEMHITVIDTGIGIAEADIATALEPFRQVDSSLSRQYEGTGLGLPLATRFVELHGGALKLESEPNIGTQVTVSFPKSRVCTSTAAEPEPATAG